MTTESLTYEIIDGVVYFSDGSIITEQAFNDMKADSMWDLVVTKRRKHDPNCPCYGEANPYLPYCEC